MHFKLIEDCCHRMAVVMIKEEVRMAVAMMDLCHNLVVSIRAGGRHLLILSALQKRTKTGLKIEKIDDKK